MSKLTLKLDEANDLNFQFKVQGTSSEPGASNIQFRFVVFEQDNPGSVGFVFPVSAKEEDGTITVSIPKTKDLFKENTSYIGKVEVIIGSRLLVPTTMELEFVKTLAVEITRIPPKVQKPDDRRSIEDMLPELEDDQPEVRENASRAAPKKSVTLTKTQLQALLNERRQQKPKPLPENPMKASMKSLMKSALSEED